MEETTPLEEKTPGPLPSLHKRRRWPIWVLLAATAWLLIRWALHSSPSAAPERLDEGTYRVQTIAPDLTLRLTNHAQVRLIGIRCPAESPLSESPLSESPLSESPLSESPLSESPLSESPLSESPVSEPPVADATQRQAVSFATRAVGDGQVRLRFDRERIDGEHRFLAYVFVDDIFLNEELLRRGLAKTSFERTIADPFRKRLRKAELEARSNRLGVWSTQD